ncbi:MAG: ribosome maturation factor RimP, partial [Oscillospiraceae bacterium]
KTEAHFAQFMGTEVEVRLYRAVNGAKAVVGILTGYEKGDVTLETPAGPITITKQDVAQVRLTITF